MRWRAKGQSGYCYLIMVWEKHLAVWISEMILSLFTDKDELVVSHQGVLTHSPPTKPLYVSWNKQSWWRCFVVMAGLGKSSDIESIQNPIQDESIEAGNQPAGLIASLTWKKINYPDFGYSLCVLELKSSLLNKACWMIISMSWCLIFNENWIW